MENKKVVLNASNIEESMENIIEIVGDTISKQMTDEEKEMYEKLAGTEEEKKEKIDLGDKLRGIIKSLSSVKFNIECMVVAKKYKVNIEEVKSLKARAILNGFANAFNITIDLVFSSFKALLALLQYILLKAMALSLGLLRKLVNTLLKVSEV